MNVFNLNLIGHEFKTVDKINVKYADVVNQLYDSYYNIKSLLAIDSISEYEFTIQYIMLYNKAIRYLEKLMLDDVIDFDTYNELLSYFEEW